MPDEANNKTVVEAAVPSAEPELVLSFQRFAQRVPLGHADRLMLGVLRRFHGHEKHTEPQWRNLVVQLRKRPVAHRAA